MEFKITIDEELSTYQNFNNLRKIEISSNPEDQVVTLRIRRKYDSSDVAGEIIKIKKSEWATICRLFLDQR